jgi:hypothetical protein
MSFSSRLTQIVLGMRKRLGVDNPQGAGTATDDPRGRALDAKLKRWAPMAGRMGCHLNLLAALCGTDKYGAHDYTPIYHELMARSRRRPIRLLEIGVGGFQGVVGGESLLMWAAYFPKGEVFGIDIHDKTAFSRGRIRVLQCSQIDRAGLVAIGEAHGPFDYIIDDGSHASPHQIESFRILWPFIKDRGVYIIEDVQTSYWPSFAGGTFGSEDYARSCVSYFRGLVDSVNLPEFLEPAKPGSPLDPTIGSIAFHHNLIVLTKDASARTSNFPLGDPQVRAALMRRGGPAPSGSA